uniref:Uncharacterized protein n=1 Tax=Gadus morhua TaxID=8049 RepID=A0A8C5CD04_GADMO
MSHKNELMGDDLLKIDYQIDDAEIGSTQQHVYNTCTTGVLCASRLSNPTDLCSGPSSSGPLFLCL